MLKKDAALFMYACPPAPPLDWKDNRSLKINNTIFSLFQLQNCEQFFQNVVCIMSRTSALLVKVNSTYIKH